MAAKPDFSVSAAAPYLDTSPGALRKAIQEAVKASGGRADVRVNGVRAFKRGRLWRVAFGSSWKPNGVLAHWRSPKTLACELGCVPATVRRALQPNDAKGSRREVTVRGVCYACRKFAGCWKLLAIATTSARVSGREASHV